MYLICKSAHFVLTGPAPVDVRLKAGQLGAIAPGTMPGLPAPGVGVLSIF
jgi:hypothetical protein